ncbi:hypothetical protein ACTQ54_02505 [Fundicoccus sp. Sow4_H7]|uniref:hypothetical protein n=1 Tax=Fundicoccus sp. Sow4_H7 TaxID=3438784 RepID=UPI003F93A719
MLAELIENWEQYCNEENFVGIGSTRKAYHVSDYVIKVNIHPLGYDQSKNEFEIYTAMAKQSQDSLLAQTFYVDDHISIQKYYKPLELIDNQSYEIDLKEHAHLIPDSFVQTLNVLDKTFDCFDLKDSGNFGLDDEGKLVFIDYGMTKSLYEAEWVPLAEEGILPQIYFELCNRCGEEKELRMYGEDDQDKRCFDCGKE